MHVTSCRATSFTWIKTGIHVDRYVCHNWRFEDKFVLLLSSLLLLLFKMNSGSPFQLYIYKKWQKNLVQFSHRIWYETAMVWIDQWIRPNWPQSEKTTSLTSRGLQQIRNNHWNHIHVFCYQKILFDTLLAYENSAIIGLNKNNIKINWPPSWSSCRTRLSWFVWYDCVCKHK